MLGRAKCGVYKLDNVTHKLDLTPMQALDAYSLHDEQEKYFEQQKVPLGCDRQRSWS